MRAELAQIRLELLQKQEQQAEAAARAAQAAAEAALQQQMAQRHQLEATLENVRFAERHSSMVSGADFPASLPHVPCFPYAPIF